jgi:hypothetical protein
MRSPHSPEAMDCLRQTTKNRRWLWAKSHLDESSGPAESSHPRQKAEDISALHRSRGCISANIAYSVHNFNQGPNNSDKLLRRHLTRIVRPDRRRNRYPLSSAEGFFNTIGRVRSTDPRSKGGTKCQIRTTGTAQNAVCERLFET